jgi:hypothetical protein
VLGHFHSQKWVDDPIGERDLAIHPVTVTLNRHCPASPAPFDAALPYTTAAALSLALGSVIAVPMAFRLGIPAVLLAAALSQALVASLTRERLRQQADAWLAEIPSPNPSVFAWRVEELTRSERKVVGRTLRAIAEEIMRPHRRGAPILDRSRLRSESKELFEIAEALQDPKRPASARAIARTRLLITDCGSPLNNSTRHDDLHQALKSILADITAPSSTAEHESDDSSSQRDAPLKSLGRGRRRHPRADGRRTIRSLTQNCESVTGGSTNREILQ